MHRFVPLDVPALHIIGDLDPYRECSLKLQQEWYQKESSVVLTHGEGHKIPSLRTSLYSLIRDWIVVNTNNTTSK